MKFKAEGSYMERLEQLRSAMREALPAARYEHTISVSYTCVCLAMRYGADIQAAELAGLLHDCAKAIPIDKMIRRCGEAGIRLSEDDLQAPQIIHSIYGAHLAAEKYGQSPEVCSAIRWHTLGRPDMSLLEEIVFVADYIEVRRDKAEKLPELRRLAFTNLHACTASIMQASLRYLESRGSSVHSLSREAFAFYRSWLPAQEIGTIS